jgi:hypothetical protein
MVRFFRQIAMSSGLGIKSNLHDYVQCPLLTCNRMCYGYLNNDWIMVFSNLFVLAISIILLLVSKN